MPIASFADGFAIYDVTPVENIFLTEYMPFAPGDYVRVYLYTLMLCRHPSADVDHIESLARALNLSEETTLNALRYWEQKGLLVGVGDNPPCFRLINVRSAMLSGVPEENEAYAYSDFNNKLQSVFGILHPQQFQQAMDWVEELHIPTEVVLYMAHAMDEIMTAKNGGKQRSVSYAFKALNQLAMDWAKRDIRTLEKAQAELEHQKGDYAFAQRLVSEFGVKRNPTSAEMQLLRKWLGEWRFSQEEIIQALAKTTASQRPSFAYLDAILAKMRARTDTEDSWDAVKGVLSELGAGMRVPTDALVDAYERFLAQGFAPETVLRAASGLNKKGKHSFEDLEDILHKWLELGLTTPQAVEQYSKRRQELRQLTMEIFDRCGVTRRPSDADLDQTREWLATAAPEMILYAATLAQGFKLPARSIAKRLNEWKQAGIADIEAAKAFKRPSSPKQDSPEKKPASHQFEQRNYQDDFFDDFFVDLKKEDGA